jgi:hypothetical protein
MKLFFVVLAAVLATGFIGFMTLNLDQAVHRHPEAFVKPAAKPDTEPAK